MSVNVTRLGTIQREFLEMILCRLLWIVASGFMTAFEGDDGLIDAERSAHLEMMLTVGIASLHKVFHLPKGISRSLVGVLLITAMRSPMLHTIESVQQRLEATK